MSLKKDLPVGKSFFGKIEPWQHVVQVTQERFLTSGHKAKESGKKLLIFLDFHV
ncbi:MAG: hypothetical protein IKA95_04050 [Clostridia bacterium]|nr:hypothetical protein [Clostridia bacterium]